MNVKKEEFVKTIIEMRAKKRRKKETEANIVKFENIMRVKKRCRRK